MQQSSKASNGNDIESVSDMLEQEQESASVTEGQQDVQQEAQQVAQQGSDQSGSSDQDNSAISQEDIVVSRMCEALQNNEVFTTDKPMEIEFTYEIVVNQDFVVDETVSSMDTQLAQVVGKEMIDCDNTSQRMRALQQKSEVQGIDSYPPDEVTGESCTYFTVEDGTRPPNTNCRVINGIMTLYLNGTDDGSTAQKIQSFLQNSLNIKGDQFLDSIQGLEGVHYNYEGAPVTNPEAGIDRAVGQIDGDQTQENPSIGWIAGITLISVGSIALFALVLLSVRKKRRKDQESSQKFEDDQSNTDTHETLETRDFFVDITVGSNKDEEGSVQTYEARARNLPRYLTNPEF